MMNPSPLPSRGEIWNILFDPSVGDEIQKLRPAVVISTPLAGRMQLRIVVPITGWQPQFARYFWMVSLKPDTRNNLAKLSAADAFQVKSCSLRRFDRKVGEVSTAGLQEIVQAVAYCIGFGQP